VALGSGFAAIAAGLLTMHHHSDARIVASDCGLVTCTAAVPSPVTVSEPSPSASPHRSAKPHPARHKKKPHPRSSKTPKPVVNSPAAPATQPAGPPPTITVTYALVRSGDGGFQGEFTIANHGGSWLNGWHLTATLPGDQVTSASGSAYQVSGDTVTFDQALLQAGIAPGSSLTLSFDANGSTTSPAGCSIDGSACVA
jgi:hypothetical protein